MTANQEIGTKTARETTPLEDFNKDWNVFAADFAKAEEEQIEYLRLYRQMSTKQAACVNNVKHLAHLSKQLRRDLRNLAAKDGEMDEEMKQRLAEKRKQLNQICTKIAEMDRELPVRDNGLYLSIILGSNLNISLLNPDERYRYKQEYESFKLSVTVVILVMILLALLVSLRTQNRAIDALCNFLLVWYYCTLTIRESILRLNGSRIKGWWVLHHYFSCALCGITLTWRDGECYERIRGWFFILVLYIGIVQIIQYKYQTGCLRRLHALGQRHAMDITVEGFSSWMFKGLTFLLPFLIGGYIIQGYCSYRLFHMYLNQGCSDWQVPVLAVFFALICIGNVVTIAIVIVRKLFVENRADVAQLATKYRGKDL